jgi:hypothetical protein
MNAVPRSINLKVGHVDEGAFIKVFAMSLYAIHPAEDKSTIVASHQGTAPPNIVFGRNSDISGT